MCVCVCVCEPDLFRVKIRRFGSWARRKLKATQFGETRGREEEEEDEGQLSEVKIPRNQTN